MCLPWCWVHDANSRLGKVLGTGKHHKKQRRLAPPTQFLTQRTLRLIQLLQP